MVYRYWFPEVLTYFLFCSEKEAATCRLKVSLSPFEQCLQTTYYKVMRPILISATGWLAFTMSDVRFFDGSATMQYIYFFNRMWFERTLKGTGWVYLLTRKEVLPWWKKHHAYERVKLNWKNFRKLSGCTKLITDELEVMHIEGSRESNVN